jgi:hypothetical protein
VNAINEPDYEEVFEDLKYLEEQGAWKDGVPHWAFDFARQLGVQVGHPAVLFEGWKFVAKQAMEHLDRLWENDPARDE